MAADTNSLTSGFSSPDDDIASSGRFRMIDLFAGCGGLTKGFVDARCDGRAVYESIAAVEIDRAAAATYAANFGSHVYQGDITAWVRREGGIPRADIVLGGPPCQGFSRLGNQDPSDERNQLWRQYLAVVHDVRPKVFVMENVDAFRRSPEFQLLMDEATRPGGLLKDYIIRHELISADEHGVPQRRRRTILVGARRDLVAPGSGERLEKLSEYELRDLLLPTPAKGDPVTVWQTISNLVLKKLDPQLPARESLINGTSIQGPFCMDELHLRRNGITDRSLERYSHIPEGGNRFNIPFHLLSDCWKKHKTGSADVMGRVFRDKPSVTIRTEFFKPEKGRYLHPWLHRPITHLEAALLQSFPMDFKWCGSRNEIARQIGNAVPVGLARVIAEHLAPLLLAQSVERPTPPAECPRQSEGRVLVEV
ncbi:DNA cytosine methyltransferase [Streptomyces sp. NBC_00385]|uniref:DNA cytosine methyltransferase n=1 Tax=Streptomyces sp. NBC_00385 TaxID=2975733 RepID=UPI002DDB0C26|nr:DNA cytosine methyltransferase [Streptomyces sp. NBC_00385]WRZ06851.1 DNA cytosine methyltransferase [Streptomyces sp. NBC_00385]